MKHYYLLFLMPLFLVSLHSKAEKKDPIVPTLEEISRTQCPIDSTASAYYIYDKADFEVSYGVHSFEERYHRKYQIHILNESAFNLGNVSIPLYGEGLEKQHIFEVSARVFNLENGEVTTTKWEKKELHYEQINDKFSRAIFALPQVKTGSIIEVDYITLRDGFHYLPDWEFQTNIPVLKSEYSVSIPEFFNFNTVIKGYHNVEDTISAKIEVLSGGATELKFLEYNARFKAHNLPAFVPQNWLFSPDNYISKVEFNLISIRMPYSTENVISKTWDDVGYTILINAGYNEQLKRTNHLKELKEKILASGLTGKALADKACLEFPKSMVWNGYDGLIASEKLSATFSARTGNAADLNLNFIGLLNELGLKAYPVALSTQRNGFIYDPYPEINAFNYVITCCEIDGVKYLTDATQTVIEWGLLPEHCANGKGLQIVDKNYQWLDLLGEQKLQSSANIKCNVQQDGNVTWSSVKEFYNASKVQLRRQVKSKNTSLDFYPGSKTTTIDYDSLTMPCKKITETKTGTAEGLTTIVDNKLILPIKLNFGVFENPLNSDMRDYPVEFSFPSKFVEQITIDIPEGYIIESLPKSAALQTTDKGLNYKINISQTDRTITVNTMFTINKLYYEPHEYHGLKEFFAQMVDKDQAQIVLRKI